MLATKLPRNLEIWRRHLAGERTFVLAKEFGISRGRVHQILFSMNRRVHRALNSLLPNTQPYIYDVWFSYELGNPQVRIHL